MNRIWRADLAAQLPRPHIIIFDVDGTLVDVTDSYRQVIVLAAAKYLDLLGLQPPELTGDCYDHFKRMGGFNDDWDLTAGLLELLLATLPPAVDPGPLPDDQRSLVAVLRESASSLAGLQLALPDWDVLQALVSAGGGGFAGVRALTGGRNRWLVARGGDAERHDLVQRIFAEIYLGPDRFAQAYGVPPAYYTDQGLAERERLLISPCTLEALSRSHRLGIATGRTGFELALFTEQFGLGDMFETCITMDDCLAATTAGQGSLLKPHPFALSLAAEAIDPSGVLSAAYVGDTADDVSAARRADGQRPWQAIALVPDPQHWIHFEALGADIILQHPDQLVSLWPAHIGH